MLEMEDGSFINPPQVSDMDGGRVFLGDIVICVPRALEQAASFGHSAEREMAFLTVHGVLHLLGYDHEKPGKEEEMQEKQEQILQALGLPRSNG